MRPYCATGRMRSTRVRSPRPPQAGGAPRAGERIAFDNPQTLTLTRLGALTPWTDPVRLMTTVIVPQLHNPVGAVRRRTGGLG